MLSFKFKFDCDVQHDMYVIPGIVHRGIAVIIIAQAPLCIIIGITYRTEQLHVEMHNTINDSNSLPQVKVNIVLPTIFLFYCRIPKIIWLTYHKMLIFCAWQPGLGSAFI